MVEARLEAAEQLQKEEAESDLADLKAAKILAEVEDNAIVLEVAGFKLSISDNAKVVALLDKEIQEVTKFLNGEPNHWK